MVREPPALERAEPLDLIRAPSSFRHRPPILSLGSWTELPGANDCAGTAHATDSQPALLGWTTNADVSINLAQRQFDNGWGACETKNNAGGYTLVSNDTNLDPILSD